MMRGRSDGVQKKRLITSVCAVSIFLGFLYVYYGSIFGSKNHGASAIEYGSRSLRRLGSSYLGGDEDTDGKQDESSTRLGFEDGEDEITPKSFPVSAFYCYTFCFICYQSQWCSYVYLWFLKVCDDRHSELIPCLDRNLIYQMRLKLDLSLMEHYERHCPPSERRFNCLIPPPPGYKVRLC